MEKEGKNIQHISEKEAQNVPVGEKSQCMLPTASESHRVISPEVFVSWGKTRVRLQEIDWTGVEVKPSAPPLPVS